MIANQLSYSNNQWFGLDQLERSPEDYQLILVMGDKSLVTEPPVIDILTNKFTKAHIPIISTAGEIYNNRAHDNTLVAVALRFDHTPIHVSVDNIRNFPDSRKLGESLAGRVDAKDLTYVMVLSCGSKVNGDELMQGITEIIGNEVLITGGMAGDGDKFQNTRVGCNALPQEGNVILISFYGDRLKVSSGVKSGWAFFGPERVVTRSIKNILYTIDGENALELYKRYLGDFAKQLPSSALFFPIAILSPDSDVPLVRTILSVDEANGSMTFAGNIPEGSTIRLMRTNTDHIINNAGMAGEEAAAFNKNPVFGMVVNCIGRKLVLGAMRDQEIISIKESLNTNTLIAGYYSYGEYSRIFHPGRGCELHNQTVVVTLFDEI